LKLSHSVRLFDKINEAPYLNSQFQDFKFIKDYEAIWSPIHKVIECRIMPCLEMGGSRSPFRKIERIYGEDLSYDDANNVKFELDKSKQGISVSIRNASKEYITLFSLKDGAPIWHLEKLPTIRIENIEITRHDDTKGLLERIGNSILFRLDVTANIGFRLKEEPNVNWFALRQKYPKHKLDKSFPSYEYDKEPMTLYWYAKSAAVMPLMQFLLLYQILEFYFPIFSQKDAHHRIKNIIKDPDFNTDIDSDITKLLNTIKYNKNQLGFGSELEQLKSTINHCVTSRELWDLINNDVDITSWHV